MLEKGATRRRVAAMKNENVAQLPKSPARRGILAQLQEKYPAKKWRAVREGMNWGYETDDGWHAGWRSCLAPTWEGDDETSESRFFIYKPNAPTEEVFFA